jgi:hypothetical protein
LEIEMKMSEAVLAWNPDSGEVAVLKHPMTPRMAAKFTCTACAGDAAFNELPTTAKALWLMTAAIDAVALDGIDGVKMRKALRAVEELRRILPASCSWAD